MHGDCLKILQINRLTDAKKSSNLHEHAACGATFMKDWLEHQECHIMSHGSLTRLCHAKVGGISCQRW